METVVLVQPHQGIILNEITYVTPSTNAMHCCTVAAQSLNPHAIVTNIHATGKNFLVYLNHFTQIGCFFLLYIYSVTGCCK